MSLLDKQFETTLETHNIPTEIKVIDKPYSIYSVCYETFKEFFVDEGFETKEKWELYLKDFSDCDQDWISDIADFYDVKWAYCDPDGDKCKGNDYFVIYEIWEMEIVNG
tara:strand:+ start:144 stop:470 length:327 start_codon:yes stop_codon:yes gene_type:complete